MKWLFNVGVGMCLGLSGMMQSAWANQPENISFKSREMTESGSKYQIYIVRCEDGSARTISSWTEHKTWCVGTDMNKDVCSNDQLKAAKQACNGNN